MNETETIILIYGTLRDRYNAMSFGLDSEDRVNKMMEQVLLNCITWPADKTGRWVGYVQCLLIEVENVTTVEIERDFTRPLFHKLYSTTGKNIPESIEI